MSKSLILQIWFLLNLLLAPTSPRSLKSIYANSNPTGLFRRYAAQTPAADRIGLLKAFKILGALAFLKSFANNPLFDWESPNSSTEYDNGPNNYGNGGYNNGGYNGGGYNNGGYNGGGYNNGGYNGGGYNNGGPPPYQNQQMNYAPNQYQAYPSYNQNGYYNNDDDSDDNCNTGCDNNSGEDDSGSNCGDSNNSGNNDSTSGSSYGGCCNPCGN